MHSSAVLRLSGFPIRLWLEAANPKLFSSVRRLNRWERQYQSLGHQLADHIGSTIIPQQQISRADRRLALQVRRHLHNGLQFSKAECEQLVELSLRFLPSSDALCRELPRAARLSRSIEALKSRLSRLSDEEPDRIHRAAAALFLNTRVAQALLRYRNPALYSELQRNHASKYQQGRKSLRRNGEYLWEIIDRAATNSTPRDWHAHVALVPISADCQTSKDINLTNEVATVWCENIHSQRQRFSKCALNDLPPDIQLSITPLHWETTERLEFWVVDPDTPTRMSEVELRRTPFLDAIYRGLAGGARPRKEFERSVLKDLTDEDPELLQKFTEHLIGLGVLQVSAAPEAYFVPWRDLGLASNETFRSNRDDGSEVNAARKDASSAPAETAEIKDRQPGFLDVYRRAAACLPLSVCKRLQDLFVQAQRILIAIQFDRSSGAFGDGPVSEQPRPLMEIVHKAITGSGGADDQSKRSLHWPAVKNPDSSYARLLGHLSAEAENGALSVELSRELLDKLGLPGGDFDWPVDCTLRVSRFEEKFEAVLDEAFPAGSLDARFVGPLRSLCGRVAHADTYHRFLHLLEQKSGTKFVEVLIPPLSVGAANAVRRPIYTRAWTGDPEAATYCNLAADLEYIPLGSISLRRVDGRLLAEADGQSLCPMYHATRLPLAPWNIVADRLLSASPLPMRWSPRRLHYSLDAFPERHYMPRISIGGELVLAGAQWRLSPDQIWSPLAGLLNKLKSIEDLRANLDLPRWVWATSENADKPTACDLESVRAISVFERLAGGNMNVLVTEMLPTPDRLLVSDEADLKVDRLASAIMLRLPCDESPEALASRLSNRFSMTTTYSPPIGTAGVNDEITI